MHFTIFDVTIIDNYVYEHLSKMFIMRNIFIKLFFTTIKSNLILKIKIYAIINLEKLNYYFNLFKL